MVRFGFKNKRISSFDTMSCVTFPKLTEISINKPKIIKVIEKVVTKEGEIRYITRQDKRREYRKEKIEDKRDYKIELKKTKNEGLEIKKDIKIARNRNILFILAILLTIIIYIFYEKTRFKNQ